MNMTATPGFDSQMKGPQILSYVRGERLGKELNLRLESARVELSTHKTSGSKKPAACWLIKDQSGGLILRVYRDTGRIEFPKPAV